MTDSVAAKRMYALTEEALAKCMAGYREGLLASKAAKTRSSDAQQRIRDAADADLLQMIANLSQNTDTESALTVVHLQCGIANARIDALVKFVVEQAEQRADFEQKAQGFMTAVAMLDIWPGKRP